MIMRPLHSISFNLQRFFSQKKYIHFFTSFLMVVSLVIYTFLLPSLKTQNFLLEKSLLELENKSKLTTNEPLELESSELNLELFHNNLGDSSQIEKTIQWLFHLAEKNDLSIIKVQFKYSKNELSKIDSTEIQLPIQGSYLTIREFCEDFLISTPFASLDEISFKRHSANEEIIEGKLKFTLLSTDKKYLYDSQNTPSLKGK